MQQLLSQLITQEMIRCSEALKLSREKEKKANDTVKKSVPSATPSKSFTTVLKPASTPIFSPPPALVFVSADVLRIVTLTFLQFVPSNHSNTDRKAFETSQKGRG